ncbi:beta-Ala-His dipeptidase [Psittacicella hinzii]|uniref:Cytosol non-specific dipeptidase n=1 Tax=Psittacicella hinzii TaxID=2028575 RepID=A0A3A1YFH2_9GAMM|nr:beta-Ala-His dipeptidase [Psittacicella hinzii]RIY36039.1 hypothetical protein CKF58_06260 [Psittacicella hinzii]
MTTSTFNLQLSQQQIFAQSALKDLNPSLVWKWFSVICSIPHPSYADQALADYIYEWGLSQAHLEVAKDEIGNVLLRKQASANCHHYPTICIQAHCDMVPQAAAHKEHNFHTDPIVPRIIQDNVYATDTTLGADNGIGLACALALLEDNSFEHGAIEVLCTRNEEVTMEGVIHLRDNWLQVSYLINTDTMQWGQMNVGCADGYDIDFTRKFPITKIEENDAIFLITVQGLRGGHSGLDIDKKHENALRILQEVLSKLGESTPFKLISLSGGQARNAIIRQAQAYLSVDNPDEIKEVLEQIIKQIKITYSHETNLNFSLCQVSTSGYTNALDYSNSLQALNFIACLPNGVLEYSSKYKAVKTSLSVGKFSLEDGEFKYQILLRSSEEDILSKTYEELKELSSQHDFTCQLMANYACWSPQENQLSQLAIKLYEQQEQQKLKLSVVHCGFECGYILQHYPQMQLISLGPEISFAHSPQEHVVIDTVTKFYTLLQRIISQLHTLTPN